MGERGRDAVHERILRAERIRNGRRLAALRTITLAFFVANALVMNLLFEPRGSYRGLVVMSGYFVLAVGLWLAVRRSEAVALKAPLIVPFLDVPFAFTLQVITLPYHGPQDVLPSAPALHAVMLFLVLVSILSLRTWIVAATAASGLALALVYASMVGLTALPWISWMIILSGSFAVMALYALRRLQALVATTAVELA